MSRNPQAYNDVIDQCNRFDGNVTQLWQFRVYNNSEPVGYMLDSYVRMLDWNGGDFRVNNDSKVIQLYPRNARSRNAVDLCNQALIDFCDRNVNRLPQVLASWTRGRRDFNGIIMDTQLDGVKMPSLVRGIFGIVTRGVHLNMYTKRRDRSGREEWLIWVARRSARATYPNKYDQVVAGAMDADDRDRPLVTLAREADEEAGLTVSRSTRAVTYRRRAIGTVREAPIVSFYDKKGAVAGGREEGQLEPGIRYTYDLEVPYDFNPTPNDDHIAAFALKPVQDVKNDLLQRDWKPNSGMIMLDFLNRHGFIGSRRDGTQQQLAGRLHRQLPFRNART